jgi:hypothetical protein
MIGKVASFLVALMCLAVVGAAVGLALTLVALGIGVVQAFAGA